VIPAEFCDSDEFRFNDGKMFSAEYLRWKNIYFRETGDTFLTRPRLAFQQRTANFRKILKIAQIENIAA